MQDGYEDYIHFFSLRTHGLVNNIPKTSLIYVHSKIMIVDDQVALIGSANINDRSMLGSRDSEVAVVIQDSRKVSSRIDGQVSMASHFAFNLRIQLFKEHLGEDQAKEIFIDPLDDRLFKMMKGIARSNSLIYREIFNVYPDDHFVKFTDLQNLEVQDEEELKVKYEKNKGKIIGHLVDFPLYFLKEENLNRSYFSKEIIVPIKNFV
jgi:phospholipase D1/2